MLFYRNAFRVKLSYARIGLSRMFELDLLLIFLDYTKFKRALFKRKPTCSTMRSVTNWKVDISSGIFILYLIHRTVSKINPLSLAVYMHIYQER